MRPRMNTDDSGIALILVLGILAVLATLATTFAFNARLEQKAARNYLDTITTDCIAKIGTEHAIALLRNDLNGYDAYTESWHTSFTGSDVDNDGDGEVDSKWIDVKDAEGNLLGAYAIYVVDEAGKININAAGNISNSGDHGSNQGWTVAEIDLRALPEIADPLHKDIVKYRYGSDDAPGISSSDNDNDSIPIECDGIDNDGDDLIDSLDTNEGDNEPDEYIPGYPFGSPENDVKFLTIEQVKLVSGIGKTTFWDSVAKTGLKNLITVYSAYCSQDRYYDGGWQDRININAVEESGGLYNMINGLSGYAAPTGQRYAANIIDYADVDYVPTVCWDYGATKPYYGVEGLQINEVMCNVSGIPREDDATYEGDGGFPGSSGTNGDVGNWKWPWDNGTYDITIYASTSGGANYAWVLENGEAGHQSGNNSVAVTVSNVQVNGGWVNLRITDTDEAEPPPEQTTDFDKILIAAGDFVEIINISELDVVIDSNWKIKYGATDHPLSSVTLTGHVPLTTTFDYLVITNSLHALDYIYGDNDGGWADDYGGSFKRIVLNSSAEFLDIANTNEDVGLYNNFGGSTDVLIDIAPYSDGYGTQGYGTVTQNYGSERPSPINDTASGNWFDSGDINSVGDYWCTPGGVNSDGLGGYISEDSSWHVHDGSYANIGLIGDVPKGTGPATTLDTTDIENFADKFTIVAQRLEGEDASTNPWGASAGTGIDGTDLYEAPGNSGSWNWVWKDGTLTGGDDNVRLVDGTYHLFVCADYPDRDFQRPSGTDREVRPNCLAYAEEVTVSGKTFTVTITGNSSDTPRLDYVLLVPKKDSPGRSGRININIPLYNSTDGKGILDGLPGITNTLEQAIVNDRDTNGPFSEIGELCDSTGANLTESEFAKISNLITVRSNVFQIICTAIAAKDIDGNNSYTDGTDIKLAEKKIEVIVDRSPLDLTGGAIRILSWKEITE